MSESSPLGTRVGFGPDTRYEIVGDSTVPWTFASFEEDYRVLRDGAGAVDLSSCGLIGVRGAGAEEVLNGSLSRDVAYMTPERTIMGLILEDDGRPVDVVTVHRTDDGFLVEPSFGRGTELLKLLHERADGRAEVTDDRESFGIIGIEGPLAGVCLNGVIAEPLDGLPFQGARVTSWRDREVVVSRTGLSGEFGFKFLAAWDDLPELWADITEHAKPVGIQAIEAAMVEIRQPLVHRELQPDDSVVSAGFNWLVDLEKDDFVGLEAVVAAHEAGSPTTRCSVLSTAPLPVGLELRFEDDVVGTIVYSVYSPSLDQNCGIAAIRSDFAASNVEFSADGGATVTTVPSPAVIPTSWSVLREIALQNEAE